MAAEVTDYAILNGKSNVKLVKLVGEWIGKGWQPLGGAVFAVDEKGNPVLMQTLIRTRSARPKESLPSFRPK
jgi:hypothetical protein